MEDVAAKIEQIVAPQAEARGLEIVDVEWKRGPGKHLLRIYIDSPGGVNVDDCAEFSQAISRLLDQAETVPGRYMLEVSSPGIERRLHRAKDFQRFVGSQVHVKTRKPRDGQRNFTGELVEATADEAVIAIDDWRLRLPYDELEKANLVVRDPFKGTGTGRASK